MIVAFQGERGAYSEQAAYVFFGTRLDPRPKKTFSEVFSAVSRREVDRAVVPIENSLEGSVNQTYDLLFSTKVKVSGELELKITHCLIARKGIQLKDIKEVYSHPQALGQCSKYLQAKQWNIIPAYDTAGSVKILKEKNLGNAAAIAGRRAAEIYGMSILAEGIEDQASNYTRFLILSTRDSLPTGNDKTSIIFSVKHEPGALYEALRVFALRRINLTRIESRPTREKPWEYNFYLDFEGHRKDGRIADTIDVLRSKVTFVKILGSYPKSKKRV